MSQHRALPVLLLVLMATAPAAAEDRIVDVKPCNLGCKLWRNLSNNADTSFATPVDNASRDMGPAPAVTDGAAHPRPEEIVAQRGTVAVETAGERAARLRQRAELERALKGGPGPAEPLLPRPAKTP